MDWKDRGLVIGLRKHGETSVVLELMTQERGRHFGVVRGGRSKSLRAALQPGNRLWATWRARLEEQLGVFVVEADFLRAGALMRSSQSLHALQWVSCLLRLLPERDPHPEIFHLAEDLLDRFACEAAPSAALARFELRLLTELGFGLDLTRCAATGAHEDLIYVSPKSGRAVGREAGAPWRHRLLALPSFLLSERAPEGEDELVAAFRLTEHFLRRDLFEPRGKPLPECRDHFVRLL